MPAQGRRSSRSSTGRASTTPPSSSTSTAAIANDIAADEAHAVRRDRRRLRRSTSGKVACDHDRADAGRGRRQPLPTRVPRELRRATPTSDEALLVFDEVQTGFFGTGKPWHVAAPRRRARRRRLRQEDPGLRHLRRPRASTRSRDTSSRRVEPHQLDLGRQPRRHGALQALHRDHRAGGPRRERHRIGHAPSSRACARIARERRRLRNVRGIGSLIAFYARQPRRARRRYSRPCTTARLLALRSGEDSIRFRLPLVMTEDDTNTLLERTEASVRAITG